jgi:hypothetical protein
MALRRPYALNDTPTGNACNNAYVRISNVRFAEKRDVAMLTLEYWATRAVYLSGQFEPWKVDRTSYIVDPFDQDSAFNLKTQLYNWLKTQPEFLSAVDE